MPPVNFRAANALPPRGHWEAVRPIADEKKVYEKESYSVCMHIRGWAEYALLLYIGGNSESSTKLKLSN